MSQNDLVQLVQVVSAGAGAFLGGLVLVWRLRSIIPALFRQVRPALVQLISEAVRGTVKEELEEPRREITHLAGRVERLEGFRATHELRHIVDGTRP